MWNYSVTLSFNLILINSKKKKNEEKRPNNYSDCIIDLKRVFSSSISFVFPLQKFKITKNNVFRRSIT